MKKLILILCLSLINIVLLAQQAKLPVTRNTTKVKLSVMDVKVAKTTLLQFIEKHSLKPEYQSISKNRMTIHVSIQTEQQTELDAIIQELGYTLKNESNLLHKQKEIMRLNREISLLEKEKSQYEKLIVNMDSTQSHKYIDYHVKIITLDKTIAEKKLELDVLEQQKNLILYQIEVIEESNPANDYDNNWVNMPGVEYSYMMTENPIEGTSPDFMQGFALKYMFNRGKSYGILGLYKSLDKANPTEIDQTYIFAYGQDFYSKRLGRGQRKFFNLYTSVNMGFYNSSTSTTNVTSWFINPFVGLEIFKNKHFLIDNKLGYFLPYRNNRTQRALMYNISFNFVF